MRILNTYTKTAMSPVSVFLIVLFVILVGIVLLLKDDITRFVKRNFSGFIYRNAGNVWIALCSIFIVLTFVTIPTGIHINTYVEATIIDEYPIGALYSKYDIKERRGDIWILELKESSEETEEVVEDGNS